MKKFFILIAILALGLSACKKVVLPEKPEDGPATDPEILAEAPACFFNISVSLDGDPDTKALTLGDDAATSGFSDSDSVYVYIVGQGANDGKIACANDIVNHRMISMTLDNINGSTCDLSGALKFYYDGTGAQLAYTPDAGDIVYLFYNMQGAHFPWVNGNYVQYAYANQTGSKDGYTDPDGYGNPDNYYWGANHFDFAAAKMQITGVTGNATDGYTLTLGQVGNTANTNVSFRNMQSMFRQQLAFTDNNGDPIATDPAITDFIVSAEATEKMVASYYPFSSQSEYSYQGAIQIKNPSLSDGNVYFALMFNDDNKDEALRMHAYAADGSVYSVTKAAPTGGFANGRYYYGSSTMSWLHQVLPASSAHTTNGGLYYAPDGDDVTLRGDFPGYYITLSDFSGCHVTLGGNGTGTSFADNSFLCYSWGNASLTLESDYIINCPDYGRAISVPSGKPLKLSTTGGTYTLTLIVNETTYKGVCDSNYGSPIPATVEGASGYVAVLTTDGQNNSDGTFTYVYTVMPGAPVDIASAPKDWDRNYIASSGDVISGSFFENNKHITIPDGATVTLNGFDGFSADSFIVCEGDATILLTGSNSLKSYNETNYSALYVPEGKTLTIGGTGSLETYSPGGAGIGAGRSMPCGNITILGGTITADGGNGAGIGAGQQGASCGNITLIGGTITASGAPRCPGIGAGYDYSACGTITIHNTVTSVTATTNSSEPAPNSIGAGNYSYCGTVTIGGTVYWDGSNYQNGGDTYLTINPLVYHP